MIKYSTQHVRDEFIHAGIAEPRLMRVQIERFVTEDEKQENLRIVKTVSQEEWKKRCDIKRKEYCNTMREFMRQISCTIEGICQYNSDEFIGRNFHYYSNRGWNGSNDYDFIHLSFNDNLPEEKNQKLLNTILELAEIPMFDKLLFVVEYYHVIDNKKCKELAENKFLAIEGKTIVFNGMVGKMKRIKNTGEYGFFRLRARKYYRPVSASEMVIYKPIFTDKMAV